jgi:hypothetical protein
LSLGNKYRRLESSLLIKGLPPQEASDLHRVLFFLLIFLSDWIYPLKIHLSVAFIAETETPDEGINEICRIRFGNSVNRVHQGIREPLCTICNGFSIDT